MAGLCRLAQPTNSELRAGGGPEQLREVDTTSANSRYACQKCLIIVMGRLGPKAVIFDDSRWMYSRIMGL